MVKFSVTFSLLGKFKARGLGVSCKAHRDQCRSRANGIVDDDPAQKRVNGQVREGALFLSFRDFFQILNRKQTRVFEKSL